MKIKKNVKNNKLQLHNIRKIFKEIKEYFESTSLNCLDYTYLDELLSEILSYFNISNNIYDKKQEQLRDFCFKIYW